jgi:hypothetical protein
MALRTKKTVVLYIRRGDQKADKNLGNEFRRATEGVSRGEAGCTEYAPFAF